jgi:tRNA threonylcarbamoyladenosine modification (KEOPS) complex  Pcc1 subunit
MYKATIILDDEDLLKALEAEDDWQKSRSNLLIKGNKIEIQAKDIIAFKATVNSLIKLIEAYEKASLAIK